MVNHGEPVPKYFNTHPVYHDNPAVIIVDENGPDFFADKLKGK
ncbi:hypothetical protein [Pontiella desulfatans]|nr:hypothetical protein [Pontiella desulfatans]